MSDIQKAINLIKEGRKREAQPILEEHIRANPQDVRSWFWYVETLDSAEKRIQLLEVCLKQNPGNPQVTKALELLREKRSSLDSAPIYSSKVESYKSPIRTFEKAHRQPDAIYGDEASTSPSIYEEHGWGDPDHKQEGNLPNIEIPENELVIAYLRGFNPFYELIVPYSYDKVNNDRTHSDFSGYLISSASDLPQDCKFVVYGCAALVHPVSRVIFGFAISMSTYHRMPQKIKDEIDAHFDEVFSRGRKKKAKTQPADGTAIFSPPLESNWSSNGSYFTPNLLRKCYEYNGRRQGESAAFRLNVEEDLIKVSLPTFFDKFIDWITPILFFIVFAAIMLFILYAIDNFKSSDVIDFFKNLR